MKITAFTLAKLALATGGVALATVVAIQSGVPEIRIQIQQALPSPILGGWSRV